MTKYVTFTVAKRYQEKLLPVLSKLKDDRDRSSWICDAIMNKIDEDSYEAFSEGLEDSDD